MRPRQCGIPQLQLKSLPQAPPQKVPFAFCPSPRKVTVKQDAPPASSGDPSSAAQTQPEGKPNIRVVTEEIPADYEPTEQEIDEYAAWLGMDLESERHLFWIARQALKAPCPAPWKPCLTEDNEVFYFNFQTGDSVWDHPVDVHSKKLYLDQRAKSQAERGAPTTSLCLTLPLDEPELGSDGVQPSSPRKMTARAKPREETTISAAPPGDGSAPEVAAADAEATAGQQAQRTKITVMEEELDPNFEPSAAEIQEYAVWLGMDVEADQHLFWIAGRGLKESCPEPWKPCRIEESGDLFYFNFTTGESIWDHPCDRIYQAMYREHKGLPA